MTAFVWSDIKFSGLLKNGLGASVFKQGQIQGLDRSEVVHDWSMKMARLTTFFKLTERLLLHFGQNFDSRKSLLAKTITLFWGTVLWKNWEALVCKLL